MPIIKLNVDQDLHDNIVNADGTITVINNDGDEVNITFNTDEEQTTSEEEEDDSDPDSE
jgi:hypothetical protein